MIAIGDFTLRVPSSAADRRRGLLGRDGLDRDEGLLLERCRSVHTVGMRYPIDVVLLDGEMRPLGVVRMKTWRVLLPRPGVRHVAEVAAGRGADLSRALAARTTPDAPGIARRRRT